MAMHPRHLRTYGTTPFGKLALTHAASMVGDACLTVALAGSLFFTLQPGAARPKVLLYLVLTVAPFSIVAPVIGPALDRSRGGRRLLISLGCFGRAVLCFWMADNLNGLLLFPLAFGALVLSKGHTVAKSALVPSLVEHEEELVGANARLALIAVLASVLGALPAAGVLRVFGAAWALRLGALFFLAAGVLALRIPRAAKVRTPETTVERAQLHVPSIVMAGTAMGALRGCVGFVTFLVAFALKRQHQPTWFYGAVLAASALGGLVGVTVAPALRRKVREEVMIVGSLLAPAVVALLAARSGGRWSFMATGFAVALGASAGRIAFDSLLQRDGPDDLRGRAFARFETRFQLLWVVGALIPVAFYGVVDARLGDLLLALTLGFFGLSYLGGLRASRARRSIPPPQPHDTPVPPVVVPSDPPRPFPDHA